MLRRSYCRRQCYGVGIVNHSIRSGKGSDILHTTCEYFFIILYALILKFLTNKTRSSPLVGFLRTWPEDLFYLLYQSIGRFSLELTNIAYKNITKNLILVNKELCNKLTKCNICYKDNKSIKTAANVRFNDQRLMVGDRFPDQYRCMLTLLIIFYINL